MIFPPEPQPRPQPDVCAHWGSSHAAAAEVGRIVFVTLDKRTSHVLRTEMLLCPGCAESLRHWVRAAQEPAPPAPEQQP